MGVGFEGRAASGTRASGTRAAEPPAVSMRDRSERLAGRHSKVAVRAEVWARRRVEETFSPRVHEEARRRGRADGSATLEKLAAPKTAMWERAASARAAKENEEFEANCTFAPKTCRGPKEPAAKPASERLFKLAEKRLESLERARAASAAEEMEKLKFEPKVSAPPPELREKLAKAPRLHERIAEVLREKDRVKLTARSKVESELAKEHTFSPTLNPTSVALAKQRAAIEQAMALEEGVENIKPPPRRAPVDNLDEELTFYPKTTSKSDRYVENLIREGKVGAGFFERQREFSEKLARRGEERLSHEDDECMFSPDIGNANEILKRGGKHVRKLIESPEERSRRLAFEDAERKRAAQLAREREHYSKFSYEPKLNEKSRKIAPFGSSVDGLARDDRRERAKKRAEAEIERRFRQEHTFTPNLDRSTEAQRARNASQSSMDFSVGGRAMSARIEAYCREKEAALESLRKRAEYRELEECTFRPEITTLDARSMYSPSASKVRGMESFLEKQARARQMEEEKRERYAKVFFEDLPDVDRKHKRTIPEPFGVAENVDEKAALRRKALAEERVRRELEECTFEPMTSVARRKGNVMV